MPEALADRDLLDPPAMPIGVPPAEAAADSVGDPAYDWLGVESTHPLTWLPTAAVRRGASAC